jgi:hypothetical protein
MPSVYPPMCPFLFSVSDQLNNFHEIWCEHGASTIKFPTNNNMADVRTCNMEATLASFNISAEMMYHSISLESLQNVKP